MIGKAAPTAVSSRTRVSFVDPKTGERVPATNTETGEEVWGGEWHPNMITDAGLDRMATLTAGGDPSNPWTPLWRFISRLTLSGGMPDVKERSGAITASQTDDTVTASAPFFGPEDVGRAIVWADGLNARITAYVSPTEVAVDKVQTVDAGTFEKWHVEIESVPAPLQVTESGGSSNTLTGYEESGYLYAVASRWRQIELTENRNVNGFGLGDSAAYDASIVENIRDASGNAITVSLLAGKAIRVDHELVFRVSRAPQSISLQVDEYDAANQLVGTTYHDGHLWVAPRQDTAASAQAAVMVLYPAHAVFRTGSSANEDSGLLPHRVTPGANIQEFSNLITGTNVMQIELSEYIPGSRRRTKAITLNANFGNDNPIIGIMYRTTIGIPGVGWQNASGLVIQFDEGHEFHKEPTHTLTIGFEVRWDRDYTVS